MVTINEIYNSEEKKGTYFFSKDTMRFFNQKFSDFKVIENQGKEYIIAPSVMDFGIMFTVREWKNETLEMVKDDTKENIIKLYQES